MASAGLVEVRVLPGPFAAAVVEGLVPERDAGDPGACELLRRTLWRHGVVCVRQPAPLDDGLARAVASMIGPIKDPIGRARDGSPLRDGEDRQVIDSGFVMTDEIRGAIGEVSLGGDDVRPGLFESFHTDDSYTECPAAATSCMPARSRVAAAVTRASST